jgi:CHAT domain-containing protein
LRRSAPQRAQRPRVGVLSVVRVRELEPAAAAFANGAHALTATARRHDSAVELLSGPAASPSALGDLLGRVEIACLSCHGLARPGFGSHALLLADGATLPPQLVDVAGSARFVLDWERIPSAVPPAVLSTACSSGSGSTVEGGERVALDRSLLARGTRVFVGPLWDVGIAEGLELAAAALDRRLAGRGWAEGWLDVLSGAGDELPPAAWAAFVTVGDWRT